MYAVVVCYWVSTCVTLYLFVIICVGCVCVLVCVCVCLNNDGIPNAVTSVHHTMVFPMLLLLFTMP